MRNALLAILRITLGFVMLWPFFDKTFGLGFSTTAEKAWINGGMPTKGFLSGVAGPLSGFYNSIAGSPIVDWLFMLGLLCIGLALIFGVGMYVAGYSGALLMFLMWGASLPIKTNPILDDHIIYGVVFLYLAYAGAGEYFGFGKKWAKTKLVKKNKWLK